MITNEEKIKIEKRVKELRKLLRTMKLPYRKVESMAYTSWVKIEFKPNVSFNSYILDEWGMYGFYFESISHAEDKLTLILEMK